MKPNDSEYLRSLIDRLARLQASEDWNGNLNPAQLAALRYLVRANRFSRKPSQVTEYLGATRGTVSQTLKALLRKGMVAEMPSEGDRRSISYAVTEAGERALIEAEGAFWNALPEDAQDALTDALEATLRRLLASRDQRAFGLCQTCRHHQRRGSDRFCGLLKVPLTAAEAQQICFEHAEA